MLPGGVAWITAVKGPCATAHRVAERRSPEDGRVEGFACTGAWHTDLSELAARDDLAAGLWQDSATLVGVQPSAVPD